MKKSYREHTKTTTTTADPNYGYSTPTYDNAPSRLAIGAPNNYTSSQSQRSDMRDYNTSSSSNNYQSTGSNNNGVTINASNEPYSSNSTRHSESRAYSNNLAHSTNQSRSRQEHNVPISQNGSHGGITIPISQSGNQ